MVFDESIVGDCAFLPKVITECRKSGGGNDNAAVSRRRSLGSILPFSMGDGNTPFRVFIINQKTCHDLMIPENPILPKAEKGLRDTPYRLFSFPAIVVMSLLSCSKLLWMPSLIGGPPLIQVLPAFS